MVVEKWNRLNMWMGGGKSRLVDGLVQGAGGFSLGHLDHILTSLPASLALHQSAQICTSRFTGTVFPNLVG